MSRLNNDVVGAQTALARTFINIVTHHLATIVATVTILFSLEWRPALLSIAMVPNSGMRVNEFHS